MPDRLAANPPLVSMDDPLWLCERHGLKQGKGGVMHAHCVYATHALHTHSSASRPHPCLPLLLFIGEWMHYAILM